ncbi:MAG: hypothetical protein NTX03_12570 [Bacteroidetes bacterium]|nr:hypothetical protein [Bacteroidota bacterium]
METKNFFESFTEAQKQAVETFASVNEQMKKNIFNGKSEDLTSDYFKKWYDSQMDFFNKANANTATSVGANTNPMEAYTNWMTNQMNTMKSSMGNFPNMNNVPEEAKKALENMTEMYNNWMTTVNNTMSEVGKNINNNTAADALKNMYNNSEMYMKAFQFWSPMMKGMQDKTFTVESFKQMFNPEQFKGMLDKIFNLSPDFMKGGFDNSTASYTENMNKWAEMGKASFNDMKNNFAGSMPNFSDMLGNGNSQFNSFYNEMYKSASPFLRIAPAKTQEQAEAINNFFTEYVNYMFKDTQMKYNMYGIGNKAIEEVANTIAEKVKKGESFDSFTDVYKLFLNTIDAHYVNYFETEEYSKLQAEVTSMGFRLKKQVNNQMESALSNLPLVNRTEMDELYKTIQDLKKKVNTLEKELAKKAETKTEVKAETKSAPVAEVKTAPKAEAAKATVKTATAKKTTRK